MPVSARWMAPAEAALDSGCSVSIYEYMGWSGKGSEFGYGGSQRAAGILGCTLSSVDQMGCWVGPPEEWEIGGWLSLSTHLLEQFTLPSSILSGMLPQPGDLVTVLSPLGSGGLPEPEPGLALVTWDQRGKGEGTLCFAVLWGWILPSGLSSSPLKLGPQGGGGGKDSQASNISGHPRQGLI